MTITNHFANHHWKLLNMFEIVWLQNNGIIYGKLPFWFKNISKVQDGWQHLHGNILALKLLVCSDSYVVSGFTES